MGYLTTAGVRSVATHAGVRATRPGRVLGIPYRGASAMFGVAGGRWPDGRGLAPGATLTGARQLSNLVQVSGAVTQGLKGAYCTMTCTRGGPALVDEPRTAAIVDVTGDPRRRLIPHANVEVSRD